MVAGGVTLQFNRVIDATARATRTALLDVSDEMPQVSLTGFQDINIYVPVTDLNKVFRTSFRWETAFTGLSADNGLNYLQAATANQNISGQAKRFEFHWNELDVSATADLTHLHSNVWGSSVTSANNGVSLSDHVFVSRNDPDSADQAVPSILKLADGNELGGANVFLGTVYQNYRGAITNSGDVEFLRPTLTLSDMKTEILPRVNAADLSGYCDNVFIQAYDAYKFDLSYGQLALAAGDSISIPVKFEVTQKVQYDLSGSPIDGDDGPGGKEHTNPMLTFVVGSGANAREFTVMSSETISGEAKYNLKFIAVGNSAQPTA